MPFKKILGRITWEYPGECGAVLVDAMGESVDMTGTFSPYRLRAAGAHQGVILQNLSQHIRFQAHAEIEELRIETDAWLTLLIPVDSDYFLVCMFKKCGIELAGFVRRARCSIPELKKEMY